jgi:hypothetical protein
MEEFISEPVTALAGQFDAHSMATGVPGLPGGFTWRGLDCLIVERLDQWKQSSPEGGRAGGEVYLRRHYFRLRMNDGAIWTVYFVRVATAGRNPRSRWFLYSIERLGPQGRSSPPP